MSEGLELHGEPAAVEAAERWPHEAALQQAARFGDRDAFGVLAEYYRPVLMRYALGMYAGVDNGSYYHRAEDTVQEAIVSVLKALSRQEVAERPDPRLPYFYRAVRSEFLDWLRSAAHRRAAPAGDISSGLDNEDTERYQRGLAGETSRAVGELAQDNIARFVETDEARTALLAVWKTLNKRYRRYVYLRFVEGCSLEEISDMTGVSVGAVKSVFNRIFERSRKLEATGRLERPDSARGELIGHITYTNRDGVGQ